NNTSISFSAILAQQQADKYAFIVHQYRLLIPALQRFGITSWNLGDKDSWIRTYIIHNDWPLLFDDDYLPKPAFYSFRDALTN
ncbi:MAG: endo-1,4-beta-xylanase, partial [Ginsengibacter sp.]